MINVFVDSGVKNNELFKQILESSDLGIKVFSDINDIKVDHVDVAVIWLNVPAYLRKFSNLKLLLTSGSGIDHLLDSFILPESVTIIRLVDKKLRNKVADYVINEVDFFRSLIDESNNSRITVGIMGLGLMGNTTAYKLKGLGYNVIGWARSKNKTGLISEFYTGLDGLLEFAKRSKVIVCQLPLTNETKHILDKSIFRLMPNDGYVINVGRGGHLNEKDLIEFVNSGQLSGACLDVFKIEPLPGNDILQNHPKIKLTPHVAGGIFPVEQAKYAIDVIDKFFRDIKDIEGIVDYKKQY